MKVAVDTFLIQVEQAVISNLNITGLNGKKIAIDTDYNRHSHSCRIGKVFACPIGISAEYSNDLVIEKGDTVVMHHFVACDDHYVPIAPGNIYRAEYFHIYGILKDNKLMPLEDVIFVEPIMEPESNMFMGSIQVKTQRGLLPQQGIIFALSKTAKKAGLMAADHVFFTHNADYEMKIVGNDLYRMKIRNITFVVRDGKPVCMADKVLIKELPKTETKGVLFCKKTLQLDGEIIEVGENVKGVKKGQIVNYYNGIGGSVEFNGERYAFVEPRHINYLLANA